MRRRFVEPVRSADLDLREAERDMLIASGIFDPRYYAAQCGLAPDADLLRHYLDVGWRWGLQPNPEFDGAFLLPFYEAAGLSGPPLLTWVDLSALGYAVPTTRLAAEWRAEIVRRSSAFDPVWYERLVGGLLDPALHYVIVGEVLGWRPSQRFDPWFYVNRYPDIAAAGLSPLVHFTQSGEREGRRPRAVAEELDFPPLADDRADSVVLMLVHEASRTGAPLLGFSIATELATRHAVVSVILRSGSLEGNFAAVSAAAIGPLTWDDWHPVEMDRLADKLLDAYKPLYAIANSIETSQLIPALSMRGVPCLALVHEFASYTKPSHKLTNAFDWASDIVFPAQVVADSSFKAAPHLVRRQGIHIFPQGRVDPPPEFVGAGGTSKPSEREREARSRLIRPAEAQDAFIVLGAGTVDIRKGVDVFVSTAAACHRLCPDLDLRFVWIGGGFDPEVDLQFSTYLAEHIERAGVSDMVRIVKPVSDLEPVYAAADAFLMSSRLDPQPNVAIDALSRGLPVVCFRGATGTAEVLSGDPETRDLVAPYLDAPGAAEILCGLAQDPARHAAMRQSVRRVARQVFDMDAYTAKLDSFGLRAAARLREEDLETLKGADLDADMVGPPAEIVPGVDGLAKVVRQQWATVGMSEDQAGNAWFRRGEAGFHPQVYARHHADACIDRHETPLAHWLRSGRRSGPWSRRVLAPLAAPKASTLRVALHGHFFYPDLLPDLLARLDGNGTRCDLFLTTDTEAKALEMQAVCLDRQGVAISVTPNRGRDIGPFLHVLGSVAERGYDLVGHVHSKRSESTDANMGDRWRDFLWSNLVGPEPVIDAVAAAAAAQPRLGLVMAEDPHLVGWDDNRALAEDLARRMGMGGNLETFFDFPLGTMFWARPDALAPLLALGLRWEDFPEEPLAGDGTLLHALERLIPFVVGHRGFDVAGIRMPGTNW